jgi:hypothetical protein
MREEGSATDTQADTRRHTRGAVGWGKEWVGGGRERASESARARESSRAREQERESKKASAREMVCQLQLMRAFKTQKRD